MKIAEECTDQSSVATSSLSLTNWWDLHHHHASSNDFSSWHHHQQNPNSNNSSSEDQDVSISTTSYTNVSNHSGLTVDQESSGRQLFHETGAAASNELITSHTSDSQLWRQVLLSTVGNNGEVHKGHNVGENLVESLSSKSGIFDQPACDYLKKMDSNNWELTSSTFNNFDNNHQYQHHYQHQHQHQHQHQLNGFNTNINHDHQNLLIRNTDSERLSNLVSNWSLAPPDPEINHHDLFNPKVNCSELDHHYLSQPGATYKQIFDPLMSRAGMLLSDLKMESGQQENNININIDQAVGSRRLLRRSLINNNNNIINGYDQIPLMSTMLGDNSKLLLHGILDSNPPNDIVNLNFNSRFTKPFLDINISKPLNTLSDPKKPTSSTRRQGNGANVGKKKRRVDESSLISDIHTSSVTKKTKHDTSTASSPKAPKVKLTDRITTLQQIVSPFGKTDTASVLYEAIQYIKFLQEQVQLFSNPYLKTNTHKDPWGNLDRKEKGGYNLRSRGLCLVPISSTPQSYRENNGSDYWTPAYRGCLYR